jgi:hypothetical protein
MGRRLATDYKGEGNIEVPVALFGTHMVMAVHSELIMIHRWITLMKTYWSCKHHLSNI